MARPSLRRNRRLLPEPAGPATVVRLDAKAEALRHLREGLARTPREIACKYLYDDRGSALFEKITRLPEYYPTRTETKLLRERARAIVEAAGGAALSDVLEWGSAAAETTVCLLDAALAAGGHPRYLAVDISAHALERTRHILAAARPEVHVEPVHADYTRALDLPPRKQGGRRLVLFLGGTIGNDEDAEAVALLSRVREHLDQGDLLLLGANLVTDPAAIHAAYNDAQGVTAEFNKNLLNVVNAVARSGFDPAKFDHHAPYVVGKRRIEMWLVARQAMQVDLGRVGGRIALRKGEGIRTEISRRFVRDDVLRMIDAAGFTPERWIESPDGRFGLALGLSRTALRGLL